MTEIIAQSATKTTEEQKGAGTLKKQEDVKRFFLSVGEKEFQYDEAIGGSEKGSKKRPDFLFDMKTFAIAVEVDEDQHKSYNPRMERKRMKEIFIAEKKPVIFIRFNPDSAIVEGDEICINMSQRYKMLLNVLQGFKEKYKTRKPPKSKILVAYLCYDNERRELIQNTEIHVTTRK